MKKVQSLSQRGMMSCSNISTSQHNHHTPRHQDHNQSQNTDSDKNSGGRNTSKNLGGQIVQPLKKEFFLSVLDLEEKLFGSEKKQASAGVIDALIGKYAQCIEYFDAINNPITVYFLEKIQITLSTSRLLSLLVTSEQLHGNQLSQGQTQQEHQEHIYADKVHPPTNEKMLQSIGNLHNQQTNNLKENISDAKPTGFENKTNYILQQQQQLPQHHSHHRSTTPGKHPPKYQEHNAIDYFSGKTEVPISIGFHRKQQQSLDLLSEMSILSSYDRSDEIIQRQSSQTNYLMQFDENSLIENSNCNDVNDNPELFSYNEKQKKVERAKRVDLYLRVRQAHHSPQNTDFAKLLNNFQNIAESNDRVIRNDLKLQIEAIETRLTIKRNTHIAKQRDNTLAILNQKNTKNDESKNVDNANDHGSKDGLDEQGNEVEDDDCEVEEVNSYDNENKDNQGNKININNLNQNIINQDEIPIKMQ